HASPTTSHLYVIFFFQCYRVLRDLHSFPTRRSSDLFGELNTPLVVTYHPAYLLRTPGDKRKAWEDLKFARGVYQQLTQGTATDGDRKSTRLNSSHLGISYAVFCLKKKNTIYKYKVTS